MFSSFFYRLLLGGVLIVYIAFGLYHLQSFVTADEHYWVSERIPQYWEAISKHKWTKTFINDKPGVSIALISGVGSLLYPDSEQFCAEKDDRTLHCDTEKTGGLYQAFRLPLLFINGALLVILFFLIERLFSSRIAFLTILLCAWSPILLGISQIVNPDTLLWSFSAAALFSYFSLLYFEEKKYLFLTLFFMALAILSKYVAIILLPFFLALTLFRFLTATEDHLQSRILLKKDLVSLFFLLCGIIVLVCFFLPALLFDSKYLLEFIQTVPDKEVLTGIAVTFLTLLLVDTFFLKNFLLLQLKKTKKYWRVLGYCSTFFFLALFCGLLIIRNFFPDWSIFTLIAFDLKDLSDARYYTDIPNFFESFILEWNPLVFSLTPITLIGFLILLFMNTQQKGSRERFTVFSLFFFFLLYTLLLIYSNILTTPRYSIMLYPLFAFLGALGFSLLIDRLVHVRFTQTGILGIIVLASFISLFSSIPFYFNYTNVLLPKTSMIQDAWGYGGYEAAEYLNSLPDAENLTVWADYYGVCEFFVGHCLTAYTFDKTVVQPDYYVLTRRGSMRYLSRASRWERLSGLTAYRYYGKKDPDWQLLIDNRPGNFIKVFKVNKEFQAAIITDIDHCPSREPVSEARLQSFLSLSEERDAGLLVSLGDNGSHRLRNCSETADMDVRYIAEKLRSSGKQVHFVLGDHDIASSVTSYQNWIETTDQETTYYSFDEKDVHVIVLDTVLGGEPMRPPCTEDSSCSALQTRLTDLEKLSFATYQEKYSDTLPSRSREILFIKKALNQEKVAIDLTRSFGRRDTGRLSQLELDFLQEDLKTTKLQKVVIFSDHPLFPFVSARKSYNITNGEKARKILEESGKDIAAISGEAHLWHETNINGVRYFIVDEFRKANGSWAYLTWNSNGPILEHITH